MPTDLLSYLKSIQPQFQQLATVEGESAFKVTSLLIDKIEAGDFKSLDGNVDRRKFNRSCALFVVEAHRKHGTEWFLAKDLIAADPRINRDATQAQHWGLVEPSNEHTKNGKTDGWWRVTPLGVLFSRREHTVASYRVTVDGVLSRLEGPEMTLQDSLGEWFNYDEHMAGYPT